MIWGLTPPPTPQNKRLQFVKSDRPGLEWSPCHIPLGYIINIHWRLAGISALRRCIISFYPQNIKWATIATLFMAEDEAGQEEQGN